MVAAIPERAIRSRRLTRSSSSVSSNLRARDRHLPRGSSPLCNGQASTRRHISVMPQAVDSSSPVDAARLPAAGSELAAVDDAVVLVAGGAEHRRAVHAAVTDVALEEIADGAAFVAGRERELDLIAVQPPADRTLEMGRALLAGDFGAALLEVEAVDPRALQKVDAQFPLAGYLGLGRPIGSWRVPAALAQRRRDRLTDLSRLAGL